MKKTMIMISLFILNLSFGQNLIINGDFELGQIPYQKGQLSYANGWSINCSTPSMVTAGITADLLDRNTTNSEIDVPINDYGNLDERNGNNRYVHFAQAQGGLSGNEFNSEILKGSLCSRLIEGNYNLNFWVALPSSFNYIPMNKDKQIVEVYLVNNDDCDGKLIYTTPNITQTNWTQLNTSFTINAIESNQYNKILIKFKKFFYYITQTILIDGFDLRKLCDPISFEIPDIIYSCGQPEELCAPNPPLCENYNYTWTYQNGQNTTTTRCFTPTEPGNYNLTITNNNGCTFTHNFTVLNSVPSVELGHDINLCKGDKFPLININNQGFDDSNSIITWYHNGNVIQNGGTVLNYIPNSGTISVTISMPGCQGTTTDQIQVLIRDCCPENVKIGIMLCKGEEPIFHVLNQGFDDPNIEITWLFDGQVIQNGGEILEIPVYGNGELTVVISKIGCPKITDTIPISCNNNGEQTACFKFKDVISQSTSDSFYGPMPINEFCIKNNIFIDGSCSQNENGYFLRISEFNLSSWTIVQDLYNNWISSSGTVPASINLNNLVSPNSFLLGKTYLVSLSTGPAWVSAPPQFFRISNNCIKANSANIESTKTKEINSYAIYPNPTTEKVNITFNKNKTGKIEIYSLEGKLLFSNEFKESNQIEVNLSNYKIGIYIARINLGEELITQKIIKE